MPTNFIMLTFVLLETFATTISSELSFLQKLFACLKFKSFVDFSQMHKLLEGFLIFSGDADLETEYSEKISHHDDGPTPNRGRSIFILVLFLCRA